MKITTKQAAEALGVQIKTVQKGLQEGAFVWGTAFIEKGGKNYTYVIYPRKFMEMVGGITDDDRK